MKKEHVYLEYSFGKVSLTILWNAISTPAGLETWFADNVRVDGSVYTFGWSKNEQEAELIAYKAFSHIRFHWLDDDFEDSFFEFKIHTSPMTSDTKLEVVDYNLNEDIDDTTTLWNSQIDLLRRKLGVQ